MELADFRCNASEIGNLLGCFGAAKQLKTIYKIWSKSSLKHSYVKEQQDIWENSTLHTHRLNIQAAWENLMKEAYTCCDTFAIEQVVEKGFLLCFQNEVTTHIVNNLMKDLDETNGELLQEALSHYDLCYNNLTKLLMEAQVTSIVYENIQFLLKSCKLCYMLYMNCCRSYGIHAEKRTKDFYNHTHIHPIEQEQKEFSKQLAFEGINIAIDGKIDGINSATNSIFEIKHRVKKLMTTIPSYELLQVHAYMFISNTRSCELLQCIVDKNLGLYTERYLISFDESFWSQAVQQIINTCQFITRLHEDALLRECFFLLPSTQREEIVLKYLPKFVFPE